LGALYTHNPVRISCLLSVLAVAVVSALWDTVSGSTRDAVASCVYLALAAIEVFWWPKRQAQLLSNAHRAAELTRRLEA